MRWYPSSGTPASPYFAADSAWYLGCKLYEIGNHLGNIVSVISDRKQAFDMDMDDEADYYDPVVLSATDYFTKSSDEFLSSDDFTFLPPSPKNQAHHR